MRLYKPRSISLNQELSLWSLLPKWGSIKLTEKKVLYFDDYGMKEREDSYEGETLKSSFMSDGKELITLIHEN